jgi:hypothetical protein
MCVLQLTLGKLISANFPQIFAFSVWSVWTASLYIRTRVDQTARHYSCTSESARLRRQDRKVRRPDARDLFACFRGSVRPDGVKKPSGQGPHRLYKSPWPPHFLPTPPKSHLLASNECFLASFWHYRTLSCPFVHYSLIPSILLALVFSIFFKLLDFD